jgi:hypothetical protein
VGSYESRVLPAGRELEKLRPPAAADKALPELATVDDAPRRFEVHSRHATRRRENGSPDDGPRVTVAVTTVGQTDAAETLNSRA